jgi:hypothetical protein
VEEGVVGLYQKILEVPKVAPVAARIRFLFFFSISAVVLMSCLAHATDDFAAKFKAYQGAVSAGKTALNKKDYGAAIKHFSDAIETEKKAIDLGPSNKEFKENLALYERESKKH